MSDKHTWLMVYQYPSKGNQACHFSLDFLEHSTDITSALHIEQMSDKHTWLMACQSHPQGNQACHFLMTSWNIQLIKLVPSTLDPLTW